MLTTPRSFRAAMLEPIKQVGAKVISDDIVYDQSDVLQSVVIKSAGYYFGSCTRVATIKLLGVGYSLIDKRLEIIQTTLTDVSTNTWQEMSHGIFIVKAQEVDLEKEITTIQAYDMLGVLGQTEYRIEDGIIFPCTIASLASQIANHFGLRLVTDFNQLPNTTHTISEDLYASITGITYRDILSEIAGATATIVKVDTEGGLEFRSLAKEIDDSWTYADLIKLKIEPKYGPINAIVLARTPQEDNIALQDQDNIDTNGLTEVKLANNQIMDGHREEFAKPLLDAIKGFGFIPASATTTGHGWHEVGDRIAITDNTGNIYEIVLTDISLTLDGGIKEVISSVAPTETQTNYAMAGGITRTIYNTEIKVDKQKQQIESTVGKQETIENEMNANFTQILQDVVSIAMSVQNSGGSNLIKNSAAYNLNSEQLPEHWNTTIPGGSALTVAASSEATNRGSISNNIITLRGAIMTQRIPVVADDGSADPTKYTFSVKIKKTAARGTGVITLTDGISTYQITIPANDEPYYKEYSIKGIVPKNNYLDLTVTGSTDSDFTVTDMMFAVGDYVTQWAQANGEFANTQVSITVDGMKVKSNTLPDTYSLQTALGFSGSNGNKTYKLDSDSVSSDKAIIGSEIDLPPLKILSRSTGWAIVKKEE